MKTGGKICIAGCLLVFLAGAQVMGQSIETARNFVSLNVINDSIQAVKIQIISQTMVSATYPLQANRRLKLKVNVGDNVKILYRTNPYETLLSKMGSMNELNRTIYLKNDGDTIFVQEKYFGERLKGKGSKRILRPFISSPEEHRENIVRRNSNVRKKSDRSQSLQPGSSLQDGFSSKGGKKKSQIGAATSSSKKGEKKDKKGSRKK